MAHSIAKSMAFEGSEINVASWFAVSGASMIFWPMTHYFFEMVELEQDWACMVARVYTMHVYECEYQRCGLQPLCTQC